MSQALPARADDERDAAANAAAEAEATVNALQSQLEGIDASLAQVFIDLQSSQRADSGARRPPTTSATADLRQEVPRAHDDPGRAERRAGRADPHRPVAERRPPPRPSDAQRGDRGAGAPQVPRRQRRSGRRGPDGGRDGVDHRPCGGCRHGAAHGEPDDDGSALDVSSSQRTQATRQDAITERISDLEEKAAQAGDRGCRPRRTTPTPSSPSSTS